MSGLSHFVQGGPASIQNGAAEEDEHCEGSLPEIQAWTARYVENRVGSCEAGWGF
jgi:hypothetical protein